MLRLSVAFVCFFVLRKIALLNHDLSLSLSLSGAGFWIFVFAPGFRCLCLISPHFTGYNLVKREEFYLHENHHFDKLLLPKLRLIFI